MESQDNVSHSMMSSLPPREHVNGAAASEGLDTPTTSGGSTIFFFNGAAHHFRMRRRRHDLLAETVLSSSSTPHPSCSAASSITSPTAHGKSHAPVEAADDDLSSLEGSSGDVDSSLRSPSPAQEPLSSLPMPLPPGTAAPTPPPQQRADRDGSGHGDAGGCSYLTTEGTDTVSLRQGRWIPSRYQYTVTRGPGDSGGAERGGEAEWTAPRASCPSLPSHPPAAASAFVVRFPTPSTTTAGGAIGWQGSAGSGNLNMLTPPSLANLPLTLSAEERAASGREDRSGGASGKGRAAESDDISEDLALLARRIRYEGRMRFMHRTTSSFIAHSGNAATPASASAHVGTVDDAETDFFFAPLVSGENGTEDWLRPGSPLEPL